jgi:hypothetical protein
MSGLARIVGVIFTPTALLLKVSLSLWLTTAAAGLIVMSSSQIHYERDVLAKHGLALCDGMPCFRGIVPDQTSWEQGLAPFNGQAAIFSDPFYRRITLLPSEDGEKVSAVSLDNPFDPSFTIGTVVDTFGRPSCVDTYVYQHSGTLILHYPGLHIVAQFTNNHFNAFTQATSIVLRDPLPFSSSPEAVCSLLNADDSDGRFSQYPWKGFAYIHDYALEE